MIDEILPIRSAASPGTTLRNIGITTPKELEEAERMPVQETESEGDRNRSGSTFPMIEAAPLVALLLM